MIQNPVKSRYTLNYILDDISARDIYMFWWQQKKIENLLIPMHRAYSSSARLYKVPAGGGSVHCSRSSPSLTRWTAVGCIYLKFCGLTLDCKIIIRIPHSATMTSSMLFLVLGILCPMVYTSFDSEIRKIVPLVSSIITYMKTCTSKIKNQSDHLFFKFVSTYL